MGPTIPRFSTRNYDCELPPLVRRELTGRGRTRPKRNGEVTAHVRRVIFSWSDLRSLIFVAAAGVALIVLLAVGLASLSRKPAAPAPDLVLQHSRQILAAAQAATPPPDWQPVRDVRRAQLVLYRQWTGNGWQLTDSLCTPMRGSFIAAPAPRAQLIRMPGGER